MTETQPEALFYHLDQQPLDRVLPTLVEKTVDRGWRAVIQVGSPEKLASLDAALWTYRDDSFLPHGTAADGPLERQPVVLTLDEENPNGAQVRFLVEGAGSNRLTGYTRLVFVFDGGDPAAVATARGQWKMAKAAGYAATYWQQTAEGRWTRKA